MNDDINIINSKLQLYESAKKIRQLISRISGECNILTIKSASYNFHSNGVLFSNCSKNEKLEDGGLRIGWAIEDITPEGTCIIIRTILRKDFYLCTKSAKSDCMCN